MLQPSGKQSDDRSKQCASAFNCSAAGRSSPRSGKQRCGWLLRHRSPLSACKGVCFRCFALSLDRFAIEWQNKLHPSNPKQSTGGHTLTRTWTECKKMQLLSRFAAGPRIALPIGVCHSAVYTRASEPPAPFEGNAIVSLCILSLSRHCLSVCVCLWRKVLDEVDAWLAEGTRARTRALAGSVCANGKVQFRTRRQFVGPFDGRKPVQMRASRGSLVRSCKHSEGVGGAVLGRLINLFLFAVHEHSG